MFNPNATIINCSKCGDITEQEIINGKTIKNCKRCRAENNNKKKNNKSNTPPIKYEQLPNEEFYKGEQILYVDNIKVEQDSTTTSPRGQEQAEDEEKTEEQQKQRRQEEHEQKLKQAREEQEAEFKRILKEKEEQQEAEQPKEKTIKELLNDILNKLDNPATINDNNNNKQEDTTPIINNILNTINNNDNKLNDFIKEQQLKNKIIINKLDNILKAIT
jgi:hypothetical protein